MPNPRALSAPSMWRERAVDPERPTPPPTRAGTAEAAAERREEEDAEGSAAAAPVPAPECCWCIRTERGVNIARGGDGRMSL